MRTKLIVAGAATLSAVAIALPAGAIASGSAETATPSGVTLYKKNCASCHALAAAKSKGTFGPNLDKLKPSLALLKTQIKNGGGSMPAFKGKLTTAQINAIAVYVYNSTHKKS